MSKMATILLFAVTIVIAITPTVVDGVIEGPEAVKTWFGTLPGRAQKTTYLDFYFHDVLSGKNPSAVPIVQPSNGGPTFGSTYQVDDLLTVGPDPSSVELGRAQGTYSLSSQEDIILHMSLTFGFTSGEFNGSTLSVLSRNPVGHEYREMAVVGGTGLFRLAQGIATAKTVTANALGDAVVHYGVSVLHYSDGVTKGANTGGTSGQVAAAAPTHSFVFTVTMVLLFVFFTLAPVHS